MPSGAERCVLEEMRGLVVDLERVIAVEEIDVESLLSHRLQRNTYVTRAQDGMTGALARTDGVRDVNDPGATAEREQLPAENARNTLHTLTPNCSPTLANDRPDA